MHHDVARVTIILRDKTSFSKEKDVYLDNEYDIESGYQAHKEIVKELCIEHNVNPKDVRDIRVCLNINENDSYYHFLECWDGEKFVSIV